MSKQTIKQMLEMIDAKIEHIEDISADNRAVIIKLVKQSNEIVKFLRNLEIEVQDYDVDDSSQFKELFDKSEKEKNEKLMQLRELFDEFKEKQKGLKEFEEELEKVKGEITPGQVGEA